MTCNVGATVVSPGSPCFYIKLSVVDVLSNDHDNHTENERILYKTIPFGFGLSSWNYVQYSS